MVLFKRKFELLLSLFFVNYLYIRISIYSMGKKKTKKKLGYVPVIIVYYSYCRHRLG